MKWRDIGNFFHAEFELIEWDKIPRPPVTKEVGESDWIDELCDMAMKDLAEEEVESR